MPAKLRISYPLTETELVFPLPPMKVSEARNQFQNELSSLYEPGELNEIISLAFEAVKGFSKTDIIIKSDTLITAEDQSQLQKILSQLKTNKPIQYILGYSWFYGMKFLVNEHVLIPRPETEELVSWIISQISNLKSQISILDIGTGTGCIAIALKKNLPNAQVSAIDISEKALDVAKKNAHAHNTQINFIHADILTPLSFGEGLGVRPDLIVSNPPYVLPSEKSTLHSRVINHEPHTALFASEADPIIFYRAIADYAQKHLTPNGKLFFEIHYGKAHEIKNLLQSKGFTNIEIRKDISGKDRMIKASK